MALKGLDIFKLTPKTNCKECGNPTCMAFSMKVAQGAAQLDACPHITDDVKAQLAEATAPPMKTIKVGEHQLGGETVLCRHEKTFVSKTLYAVALCDCMDDATVDAKLEDIKKGETEKKLIDKYGNTAPAHLIELLIAMVGMAVGTKMAVSVVEKVMDR